MSSGRTLTVANRREKKLFACFQAFLAKGNLNEKRQLCLLETYQPVNSDIIPRKRRVFSTHFTQQPPLPLISSPQSHLQPDSLPGSYPRPHSRPHLCPQAPAPTLAGKTPPPAKSTAAQEKCSTKTGEQNLSPLKSAQDLPIQNIAIDYFRHDLKIEDANQLKRLVKAAIGFIGKQRVELKVHDIWSRKSGIFDLAESSKFSRVCRLFRGRQRLSQDMTLYDCADRMSLVFIHHEVSEKMRTIDPDLSRHQKRITVACRDIAQELGISSTSLKRYRDNGRCYLELFLQAGPADLLALGSGQSTMYD